MNLRDMKEAAFPEWFTKHPMTQAILKEKTDSILLRRKEAHGKIEALQKERDEAIPRLLSDREAKEAKHKKAFAAMEAAGTEFNAARVMLSTESYNFDTAIRHEEEILYGCYDPAIDEGIQFFRDKLIWLRSPGRISINHLGGERNIFTESVKLTAESNTGAINQAMKFCINAIKELEKMKLSPELDLQKIEALKKAVPSIDEYTESTGEKPMEGSKGRSLASFFKSEDQHNFEMSKLLKKADKLLSGKGARA